MKILKLYKLFAGTMTDFTNRFKNNQALYNQAKDYWDKLEGFSIIILGICIFLGLAMAISYYKPYNNMPGRHYKPIYWLGFLFGTFVLTFFSTWGFEYFASHPHLSGAQFLLIKIALGNAIYASLLFFVCSWVWCQFNLPTNACRFLKL